MELAASYISKVNIDPNEWSEWVKQMWGLFKNKPDLLGNLSLYAPLL